MFLKETKHFVVYVVSFDSVFLKLLFLGYKIDV